MPQWSRWSPFESANQQMENWVLQDNNRESRYMVDVTLGKPVDILALKLNMTEDYHAHVVKYRDSRKHLFDPSNLERVNECPICGHSGDVLQALNVHGGQYVQCPSCTHYYVQERPKPSALEAFYSGDKHYQSTYADPRTTETRLRQVATPKAEWAVRQFARLYGRPPRSILDVGAGSGHFVQACRLLGYEAAGVELSEFGREFCKANFGFELINRNFIEEWDALRKHELITFWGVIEHVPQPRAMLDAARKALAGPESLVVAEVPRWNCFGTAVQTHFADTIVRHLDPLGHIHCFTDSSLATALHRCGFAPTAAWYFGMDAYEWVTQLAYNMREEQIIEVAGKAIPRLQEALDRGRLSDEVVMAGYQWIIDD